MTILDSAIVVGSGGEYQRRLQELKETPRIYEFQYMLNDNLSKITLAAASEDDAERLFVELMGDSKYRVESRGSSGHLDYVCPSLLTFYRRRLGKELIDRYHAYIRVKAEQAEAAKKAEEVKNSAAKARRKEQERDHAVDYLTNAINFVKRMNVFTQRREDEQAKDFKEWIKKDGK